MLGREGWFMRGDLPTSYLSALSEAQRKAVSHTNGPGLEALRDYLDSGQAVAFLGAGVSAPLYPLWTPLIGQLVDEATDRLTDAEAATCRVLARDSPEEVVEILRQSLTPPVYREVLRGVLRARTDPVSGRSWTPLHELVCRCAFKGVATTNYDPGIVDARQRVRPGTSATGFTIWDDELGLDEWRTERVFAETELPVLYAHGQHNRPDTVVLATSEYRRAYEGKLSQVLRRLVDGGHLVWIGFSFADQRIVAILREVAYWSGTRADPGAAPSHVAIMPWDPDGEGNDPGVLARRVQISYGAQVVLYPAPGGDHSALPQLLAELTDPRFPAVANLPAAADSPPAAAAWPDPAADSPTPVTWVPGAETVEYFTGRAEELARLDRWAADPDVGLVGVTAWGGAGKTALVTHWTEQPGRARRTGVRGTFGWSFESDPSPERWAGALLAWAGQEFDWNVLPTARPAAAVLALLREIPLLLVLDGLEVVQEGPARDGFGRLLNGTLQEVLSGACRLRHSGLVMLTSRFPFADLEAFEGSTARMLEVPPFTLAEGAELLAAAGVYWLGEAERQSLVQAVDGHALAVGILAGVLADRPPTSEVDALRSDLESAARTSARVSRVLRFYADRLSEADQYLVAAVSLFARPVPAEAVLQVAEHDTFAGRLAGWTPDRVETAVRDRLSGLVSLQLDGRISAHPLVRDTFRPLARGAAEIAADVALTGMPEGQVTGQADALRVVETIELLLDADQWQLADDLYRRRTNRGFAWMTLPAARLGQRAATAFVATSARRERCADLLPERSLGFYLNATGVFAINAGDLVTARVYLRMSVLRDRDVGDSKNLSISLQNLAECHCRLGDVEQARDAAANASAAAARAGDENQIRDAHAHLGWIASERGKAEEAEQHFTAADEIALADDRDGDHLFSRSGAQWAEWLARTGRPEPAEALTRRNREICMTNGWNDDVARCDRLLGRMALASGDIPHAGHHLMAAAETFRDGDYLTELAVTLIDLADHARAAGDFDTADSHATEAITIAAPRGLIPAQSSALAARARIRADQAAAAADNAQLAQGRDAADAAHRLAVRHHLPWCELDALRAHAALDRAEPTDLGWAARADTLHVSLVPPGLDPDPLATAEQ
jgi:tetratricopeptide (TPR) repeat protein